MKKIYVLTFFSVCLFASLAPPSRLIFTNVTKNSVTLNWIDNSNNESGFKIYRDGKLIDITEKDVVSYVDKGLSPNRSYKYTVKSTDSSIKTLEMQVLKKFNKTNFKKGDSGRAKNLDELINIWASPECKSSEKVLYNKEGLNLYYSILLSDNENGEYDGNDVERCELGINEWREKGSIDGEWPLESTFTLYKEGSHNVTFFHFV
jgi:hypothetical protein